jgi:hypothetical protein
MTEILTDLTEDLCQAEGEEWRQKEEHPSGESHSPQHQCPFKIEGHAPKVMSR